MSLSPNRLSPKRLFWIDCCRPIVCRPKNNSPKRLSPNWFFAQPSAPRQTGVVCIRFGLHGLNLICDIRPMTDLKSASVKLESTNRLLWITRNATTRHHYFETYTKTFINAMFTSFNLQLKFGIDSVVSTVTGRFAPWLKETKEC